MRICIKSQEFGFKSVAEVTEAVYFDEEKKLLMFNPACDQGYAAFEVEPEQADNITKKLLEDGYCDLSDLLALPFVPSEMGDEDYEDDEEEEY